MDRSQTRAANQETAPLGWISCEHCGAPKRVSWFTQADMYFCSWEHLQADAVAAAGPPEERKN